MIPNVVNKNVRKKKNFYGIQATEDVIKKFNKLSQ